MNKIGLLLIFLFLNSCASVPISPQGTESQKLEALTAPAKNKNRAIIILHRLDRFDGGAADKGFFVNQKLTAILPNDSFTRIEIVPGKHNFTMYSANGFGDSLESDHYWKLHHFKIKKGQTYILTYNINKHSAGVDRAYMFKEDVDFNDLKSKIMSNKDNEDITFHFAEIYDHKSHIITSEDREVWASFKNLKSTIAMNNFIEQYPDSPFVSKANSKLEKLKANEIKKAQELKSQANINKYFLYLKNNPELHNKLDIYKSMVVLIKKKQNKGSLFSKLYNIDHESNVFLPEYYQMQLTLFDLGPDELKIKQISKILKSGFSEKLLASKIRAISGKYKNFSFKEINFLKKKGLTDETISAMIDATTKFNERVKSEQQNKKMMDQIKALLAKSQNSISAEALKKDGGNTPLACIKLKAALSACSKLSGFLAMTCNITAKSTSDCKMNL